MKKNILIGIALIAILSTGFFIKFNIDNGNVVRIPDANEKKNDEKVNEDKDDDEIDEKNDETPKHKEVTIIATGDVMFHDSQLISAYDKESGSYEFDGVFKYVKKYIDDADIAIANFETVTVKEDNYQGYPTFNSPIESIEALKYAGFDILATANNHSLDKGVKGVLETVDNINNIGLENIGTSKANEEKLLIKEVNGINISFLSYTYGCNGYDVKNNENLSSIINVIDEEKIKNDIEYSKDNGADSIVVFLHWGKEYSRAPSDYQYELSDKIFKWGADIVLGSHPHVIQKSEIKKYDNENKFVIYSMGNFLSNQRRETLGIERKLTEDGVLVKIKLKKDLSNDNVEITSVEYIPTWVYREEEGNAFKYEIIPVEDFLESIDNLLSEEVVDKISESYKNTISIMDLKLQESISVDENY